MTRMDAIRRQYEQPAQNANVPPRRVRPVRPRSRIWLWFWFVVILALLCGFFALKSRLAPWYAANFEKNGESTLVGRLLGTTQLAKSDASVAAVKAASYMTPTEAEMSQLFEYVRNSSHVRENALYSNIMTHVKFVFGADNDKVNAFATVVRPKDGDGDATPVICFLGGAARFARVASLAVSAELCGDKGAAVRFIAALKPSDCASMDADSAVRIVGEAGLAGALSDDKVVAQAKSISAGLILGILAHESGHHSLGHVLKTGSSVNLEIFRNQEREADSFASSVIASSPFGEYILAGTLFWHYALAQQEASGAATTHPLSKERFENFVRANSDLAASLGVILK